MTVQIITGDSLDRLRSMPDESVHCVVTSPPYNIGKEYERRTSLAEYEALQTAVLTECERVLKRGGHLCWQVGNYVSDGEVTPLDALVYPIIKALGLRLRNRIAWTFGHGLHCKRRFSGRHEVVMWSTKGDDYRFDLDAVRVPQKYPHKRHFKGANKGELSGNPLGKNPGDVWDIPNVKHNHPEKTAHPCQFPEELAERLVLALTSTGDTVLDPFAGSGTVGAVCQRLGRNAILIELNPAYAEIARRRIAQDAGMFAEVAAE